METHPELPETDSEIGRLPPVSRATLLSSLGADSGKNSRAIIDRVSVVVVYSAAAIGSSVILLPVPNFETISLFIFFVAYVYGYRTGLQMMIVTTLVFEIFATMAYGAGGFLLIFKIIGYAPFVALGSYLGRLEPQVNSNLDSGASESLRTSRYVLFSTMGFTLTFFYDVVTTLSAFLIIPIYDYFLTVFVTGIPFFLFHETTNAFLFLLLPRLVKVVQYAKVESVGFE